MCTQHLNHIYSYFPSLSPKPPQTCLPSNFHLLLCLFCCNPLSPVSATCWGVDWSTWPGLGIELVQAIITLVSSSVQWRCRVQKTASCGIPSCPLDLTVWPNSKSGTMSHNVLAEWEDWNRCLLSAELSTVTNSQHTDQSYEFLCCFPQQKWLLWPRLKVALI